MSYHALADIVPSEISELDMIQLTDDTGIGQIDQAIYEAKALAADAEIDGALEAAGFSTPLSPVPQLIKNLSMGLTVWKLFKRKPRMKITDSMQKEEDARQKLLLAITKGDVRFGKTDPQPDSSGFYKGNAKARRREFSARRLKRF